MSVSGKNSAIVYKGQMYMGDAILNANVNGSASYNGVEVQRNGGTVKFKGNKLTVAPYEVLVIYNGALYAGNKKISD